MSPHITNLAIILDLDDNRSRSNILSNIRFEQKL